MTLILEPKTSPDELAPMGRAIVSAQANAYLHATALEDDDRVDEPSYVFDKLDAIAEGRHLPRPLPTRLVVTAETDEPLIPGLTPAPRHATRPSVFARLRHALSWKG